MSTAQPDPMAAHESPVCLLTPARAAQLSGLLCNGDELSRAEFHARYERTPDGFKAELLDGVVYVASPVSVHHGAPDSFVNGLCFHYSGRTPGVQAACNTTVFLGTNDEVQPDGLLRILPEFGGQTRIEHVKELDYIAGAPEFVLEVAGSSRAVDLHKKRKIYQRCGVLEYLVLCVEEQELRWFDLPNDLRVAADADGVMRSKSLPGLWIDATAICKLDFGGVMKALESGLASPEHAAFVEHLAREKVRIAATKAQA